METEDRGRASELAAGSSQATITDSAKVGSSKRVAEAELDHKGKRIITEDIYTDDLMVVHVEEVYVEAL
ncbi:hypothetical protein Tco_0770556 [Tanacetum coccineum]|uniref:Uncharacterized protein n=1 Tax=Tanacetum coccineum TaxID=301880 RepID=A0ABQ4ZDK3_9ASTR